MLLLSRASSIVSAALAGSRLRSWLAACGAGAVRARIAGRMEGPRARTGGRMRARGNMCIKFLSLNYRWNYFVFGQKLLYLGFEHRQIGGNRIPDFI